MKLKNEKGAVTLFVLVSCLFFLTSVACVNMYISSKQSAVNKEYKQIKSNYEKDLSEKTITSIYNNLKNRNNIVSFGKPQKSYKNKELFVPITLNGLSLDVKTIKYGWFYNQNNLNPETDSSLLTQISPWSYVEKEKEKENVNLNLNVQAQTACTNDGFYYLCFMLDDKPYWTNGIKSTKIQIQVGNTVQEITEDTDLDTIYGQKVTNYAKDGDNTTYRIFYIDFDGKYGDLGGIYLKADYDDTRKMNLSSYTSYNPINTSVLEKMNSEWAENRLQYKDSTDNDTKWNENEHCSAYLCDPTTSSVSSNQAWINFFDSSKANYVIGSPSVEIYCASYNSVPHTTANYELKAFYSPLNFPGYKYRYKNNNDPNATSYAEGYMTQYSDGGSVEHLGYGSMYCGTNGLNRGDWWLASPLSGINDSVCAVRGAYNCLNCGISSREFIYCPMVSLKSSFVPTISNALPGYNLTIESVSGYYATNSPYVDGDLSGNYFVELNDSGVWEDLGDLMAQIGSFDTSLTTQYVMPNGDPPYTNGFVCAIPNVSCFRIKYVLQENVPVDETISEYPFVDFTADGVYDEILIWNLGLSKGEIVSNRIVVSTENNCMSVIGMWTCLTGDMEVTIIEEDENKKKKIKRKKIKDIKVGDIVLSFDWLTMKLIENKVVYTDAKEKKFYDEYDKWIFEDGTVIKTVHNHELFNIEAKCFKYMQDWKIGEHAYKEDGTMVKLIAHKKIDETVQHYKIIGEKGTNYFVNGILTGDRNCPKNIDLPMKN